jgi:glutaredoxin 3
MKNVKIYSTPTCPYCKLAKEYFKEKGVEYTEVDVSTDMEGQKEMIEKSGGMSVPVIDIGGEVVVGFDKDKIEGLLK